MSNEIHIPEIVPETVKSSGKIIALIGLIGIVYLIIKENRENEHESTGKSGFTGENSEPRGSNSEPQAITRGIPEQNSDIGTGSEGAPNYIDHAIKRNKIITG